MGYNVDFFISGSQETFWGQPFALFLSKILIDTEKIYFYDFLPKMKITDFLHFLGLDISALRLSTSRPVENVLYPRELSSDFPNIRIKLTTSKLPNELIMGRETFLAIDPCSETTKNSERKIIVSQKFNNCFLVSLNKEREMDTLVPGDDCKCDNSPLNLFKRFKVSQYLKNTNIFYNKKFFFSRRKSSKKNKECMNNLILVPGISF